MAGSDFGQVNAATATVTFEFLTLEDTQCLSVAMLTPSW